MLEEFRFREGQRNVGTMRTMRWLVCLLALLANGPLSAADAGAVGPLEIVKQALEPVLEKLEPKPEVTQTDEDNTLVVAYRAQLYKVHSRLKSGGISPQARDELGPGFKGFVLRVSVENAGSPHQAETPQEFPEPYWQTYLDITPLAGSQKQLYWTLSYGGQADRDVLVQIRRKLAELRGTESQRTSIQGDSRQEP